MPEVYRNSSIDWKPSPVVALATSADDSQVAAAREDGSLEIWLVSPGSVGWHHQITIHGNPNHRISSLIWCRGCFKGMSYGRLYSSSMDGTVSQWDLCDLKQKTVLDSIGVSIWQMAVAPCANQALHAVPKTLNMENEGSNENDTNCKDSSESEDEADLTEPDHLSATENPLVAIACDDGSVRLYSISDLDGFVYTRSLPRVSGRVLSVTWSLDADIIYSGSSDGFIRCWNSRTGHEIYRITVGLGGLGSGSELCVWSLLFLRCGTLVSADSNGSVQFWDSRYGTLLQAHSLHKGDVNALAAAPSHNRVYSAGSDGQVVLYKLSSETGEYGDDVSSSKVMHKWIYVGYVRAHTHDIRALTVAVPISRDPFPKEEVKRVRGIKKPIDFTYGKWAHLGVPMLISGGDDTKLFAYSVKEFTKFSPHDICPAPQRVPMQLVLNTVFNQTPLLLVQASNCLDIMCIRPRGSAYREMACGTSGARVNAELVARVKSKGSRKIICSTISNSGKLFAYSDHRKPSLFELKVSKVTKHTWTVNKKQLPRVLPFAHSMVFSFDSSQLVIAGHDRLIYVVEFGSFEVIHRLTPCQELKDEELPPNKPPPITKMFTSSDGKWLAAINCLGDIYIFNFELLRQHWFISRLDGASVTAGGFPQWNNNVLVVTTSSNQIYAFDVEAKKLGDWSLGHPDALPRKFQEFPGEVIGLSFPHSTSTSAVIVYSSRAMCLVDFGLSVDRDNECSQDLAMKNFKNISVNGILKRKLSNLQTENKLSGRKNFEICSFRDPVLFVGHLSKNSLLIIDKPWLDLVKSFDSQPVHRHIFGT